MLVSMNGREPLGECTDARISLLRLWGARDLFIVYELETMWVRCYYGITVPVCR
jgi:hypothetical protein